MAQPNPSLCGRTGNGLWLIMPALVLTSPCILVSRSGYLVLSALVKLFVSTTQGSHVAPGAFWQGTHAASTTARFQVLLSTGNGSLSLRPRHFIARGIA